MRRIGAIRRRLVVASPTYRLFATPGLPQVHEARWRRRVARAPVLTPEEHAARVGLKEIEEPIGCSLCGERRMQALFETGAHVRGTRGAWRYHVVRCPSCGFLYRHPGIRPERLGDLYADSYSRFLTGRYRARRRRRYRLVMAGFDPLLADGAGRRLLDFGCGAGIFLDVAHKRGFEPWGVDLSPDSVERARARPSGANAYFGAPMDVPEIAAGGFDVVTLWSVLAHLATPVEDLTMLRGLLNDDGALLLLTVNANSLKLKANGPAWSGFTPNHLKFFSPTTLPILLRRAGFGAVVIPPFHGDPIESGRVKGLTPAQVARARRTMDAGNRGNMMRAVAFVDPGGPARWGLTEHATKL